MLPAGWVPESEEELERAIAHGLEETHHLELKRQLGDGGPANVELARDLAALAVDGGVLLIGVDEGNEKQPPRLNPVRLSGLAERIEQVAGTRIDEPIVYLQFRVIRSAANAAVGYLAVMVPESSQAPHMVDERYYGRGDRTKRVLTNDEVSRLHAERDREESAIFEALTLYMSRRSCRRSDARPSIRCRKARLAEARTTRAAD